MGALTPSHLDLSDEAAITQARHELHRAVDFGGEAEQAAWVRKWGESALAAADSVAGDHDGDAPWVNGFIKKLRAAQAAADQLRAALGEKTGNPEAVRDRAITVGRRIDDLVEFFEGERGL
ncbi:MAG: hypothetical protein EON91_02555 [Brevundimonas sp.]|uniref:hypothetical protein n=1 Tax=Brevundimonas sp. TaxID=1871086 RepID=UPI00120E6C1A|nr:hypothetical protein [Brevundimonas sp.]RZJ19094.1 MAG: hypothetical protein EON91_02555 [Brevundimonas sp.]